MILWLLHRFKDHNFHFPCFISQIFSILSFFTKSWTYDSYCLNILIILFFIDYPPAVNLRILSKRYPRYIGRYGWLRSNQFLQSLWGKRSMPSYHDPGDIESKTNDQLLSLKWNKELASPQRSNSEKYSFMPSYTTIRLTTIQSVTVTPYDSWIDIEYPAKWLNCDYFLNFPI